MEIEEREVLYCKYCSSCIHFDEDGYDSPCEECLDQPTNLYTDKPINYKKNEE